MSAEPTRISDSDAWRGWENRVVNDVFPLRRFLGGTDDSAVFLTEYQARNIANVAIKFIADDTLDAKAQLDKWRTAAKHPHPHLARLFVLGKCISAGRGFLFVVTDYAEQTLAQLLPRRALSVNELRQMLRPTLDALSFLHRSQLVHGQLKPANFLVVDDQVKLASDTIRPTGDTQGMARPLSVYDPPEAQKHGASAPGDIWSLGVTLVEALTRHTPVWTDAQRSAVSLPPDFPPIFADMVRSCLNPDPANRPTAMQLAADYKQSLQSLAAPIAKSSKQHSLQPEKPTRNSLVRTASAALAVAVAGWAVMHYSESTKNQERQVAAIAPTPVAPAVVEKPAEPAVPAASVSADAASHSPQSLAPSTQPIAPDILYRSVPVVPQELLDKLKAPVYVTLRVIVAPTGEVFGELMEHAGPNKRLARLAGDAARDWRFIAVEDKSARVWLLRFDFSREGVTATATAL